MHPQARQMIDQIVASGEPPLESLSPQEARRYVRERILRMNLTAPQLYGVENLKLAGPGGPLPVRVYRPSAEPNLPLIIVYHGGGFVVGDLDTEDPQCAILAAQCKALVVSVDYRLAPEHKFPAAADDALFAARWALANAQQLGADAKRFALFGESAGGNLATMVAQAFAHEGEHRPKMQVLIYPGLEMSTSSPGYRRFGEGMFFTERKARWFIDHYLTSAADAEDPRASPIKAKSLAGVCPALIIAAGLDPLSDEAQRYADRLRGAGVPVEYHCFEGWPHGFLFWGQTDAAHDAMRLSVQALRSVL